MPEESGAHGVSRDQWPEIEALFAAALDHPASEREAFVRREASSAEVAREVLSLLAAHARSGVFAPLAARQDAREQRSNRGAAADAARLARLRQRLADRYSVEGALGEGGMATVYLARDQKHQRSLLVLTAWSESDFQTFARTGRTPDGRQINPEFMPWEFFGKLHPDEREGQYLYLHSRRPLQSDTE
jgi:hypothetical protein